MGRVSGGWASVSLPPAPIRTRTPEERAAYRAQWDEVETELDQFLKRSEAQRKAWAARKARETPQQKADKAARDYVRWNTRQLRRAAHAARWEHITIALEARAWEREEAKRKADEWRERVRQRTAEVYAKAAAGCLYCAAFLADEAADDLYREVFNGPAAPVQQ